MSSIIDACLVLEQIECTQGSNAKKDLLEKNDSDAIRFLLHTALNPYLNYGVSDLSSEDRQVKTKVLSLESYTKLRERLSQRLVTGNAAREELYKAIDTDNPTVSKWLSRVFEKNLRCGISTTSINKIFKGLIPEFNIALCDVYDVPIDAKDAELPEGEWLASYKLDGMRCFAIINNGTVNFVSRGNKPIFNTDHIEEDLKKSGIPNCILDGELMGKKFNDTVSIAHASKSKRDNSKSLAYNVFDVITPSEWKAEAGKHTLEKRLAFIHKMFPAGKFQYVTALSHIPIASFKEAQEYAKKALAAGFEGLVIKEKNQAYPFDRSKYWLKWKPVMSFDVTITGFQEGTGKYKGTLGALICDYKGIVVDVGSGFSDVQRKQIWKDRKSLLNMMCEVQGQEQTDDGSIRFPVFIRMRDDR